MLKGRSKPEDNGVTNDDQQPQFKENPQINARIDEGIKNNEEYWKRIQATPKTRLERMVMLAHCDKQDRIKKMNEGILRKLEQNPAMKAKVESMVEGMDPKDREGAIVQIARRTFQVTAPRQTQNSGMKV